MKPRYVFFVAAAVLGTTACTTSTPNFQIRPVAIGSAPKQSTTFAELMQARGYLALGSVALALEGYRRVLRTDPANVGAMVGMAECYARMGRPDIASRYSQMALAASSGVRPGASHVAEASRQQSSEAVVPTTAELGREDGPAAAVASATSNVPTLTLSTAAAAKAMSELDVTLMPPAIKRSLLDRATGSAPAMRLQRISAQEVVLLTSTAPIKQADLQSSRALQRAQVASLTRAEPGGRPRLAMLNAARVPGLAARTREAFKAVARGEILIGDAPQVIERTELRYAGDQYAEAQRLSRRLGVPMRRARLPSGRIALWLGRDAKRLVSST
jgi:hypothetical protein